MLNKINIAVLVSGGGTNLEALLKAQEKGEIQHGRISLVISSNKNAYALTRAKNHKIKFSSIHKSDTLSQVEFENKILKKLSENNIEMIVLAGFMSILSKAFIEAFDGKIINIHPSLIPSFCGKGYYGLKVHQSALDYGVKLTGATVHFVNETPDGGKIILQKAVKINKRDTAEILQKRVMEKAEWVLLPRACEIVSKEIYKEKINAR
ncbi:MAG: phosphoribosylglycinamide formyltransferase [Candidatus Fimenecus sp.]